jgi:Family of unknown function (DUF6152)
MRLCAGLIASALPLAAAVAHHSYAMFDGSGTRTVSGTVAKLEWKNPHVFVWVYVPSREHPGKYDLWAFENGSPSVLSGRGWNSTTLKAGDKITVEYWPLKSGEIGGHFEKATFPDGHTLVGAGGPGRTGVSVAP